MRISFICTDMIQYIVVNFSSIEYKRCFSIEIAPHSTFCQNVIHMSCFLRPFVWPTKNLAFWFPGGRYEHYGLDFDR